ncbi:MAG: hypothetical protein M3Q33_06855 [Acidobacteriota bacterium]|nr:hypothetical protein [Acidobacteriota bacterium]
MRFEIDAGRKIAGGVFACVVISRDAEFRCYRLFKTELSAGALSRSNDIFAEMITACRQSCLLLKVLLI